MPRPKRKQILDALWSPDTPASGNVWAVVDCARRPRIYPAVEQCFFDKCCLYAGILPPELARAAPYLVQLYQSDHFTELLLDQGWGDSWGIFLRSKASMKTLRRHLRGFLMVQNERRKRLSFRYYDPRVLRVFLPTCSQRQLETLFGPVDHYILEGEGEDPQTMIRFGFDGEKLTEERVDLAAEE